MRRYSRQAHFRLQAQIRGGPQAGRIRKVLALTLPAATAVEGRAKGAKKAKSQRKEPRNVPQRPRGAGSHVAVKQHRSFAAFARPSIFLVRRRLREAPPRAFVRAFSQVRPYVPGALWLP